MAHPPVPPYDPSIHSLEEEGALKFAPSIFIDAEDLENYEPGGFHPVHLDETYDDGRYKIVHKLGSGGFSTVWLTHDVRENRYVALKIVSAVASQTYKDSSSAQNILATPSPLPGSEFFPSPLGNFWFDGPNGRHLCEVLPVLGPSISLTSRGQCRIRPHVARNIAYQATRALAYLHSRGLCHGDITSANVLFQLSRRFDEYSKEEVYALLGHPETDPVERYSYQSPGPWAPKYVVNAVDFSRLDPCWLDESICIIDFDQSFPTSDPPLEMLGTPSKCLAPEAIFDLRAGPASDVWALGCTIFKMRAGYHLFEEWGDGSPCGAVANMVKRIGSLPEYWRSRGFDKDGFPVRGDVSLHSEPLNNPEPLASPLKDAIFSITDASRPESSNGSESSSFFWRLSGKSSCLLSPAIKERSEWSTYIPQEEAELLHDLLSKIFIYEPAQRWSAEQLLSHQWFQP